MPDTFDRLIGELKDLVPVLEALERWHRAYNGDTNGSNLDDPYIAARMDLDRACNHWKGIVDVADDE